MFGMSFFDVFTDMLPWECFPNFEYHQERVSSISGWFKICEILISFTVLLSTFIGKVYLGIGSIFLEAYSFVSVMSSGNEYK